MNSIDTKDHLILNDLYLASAEDLLSAHGMKAQTGPKCTSEGRANKRPYYVSVLGATGEGIALSSMLKIDLDLLTSSHPMSHEKIATHDLEDWCRELNNQLVGRMKNKLLRYGVVVNLGLPVLMTRTDITAVTGPDLTVKEHTLHLGNNCLELTLSTFVDRTFRLASETDTSCDETLLEGTVALF